MVVHEGAIVVVVGGEGFVDGWWVVVVVVVVMERRWKGSGVYGSTGGIGTRDKVR